MAPLPSIRTHTNNILQLRSLNRANNYYRFCRCSCFRRLTFERSMIQLILSCKVSMKFRFETRQNAYQVAIRWASRKYRFKKYRTTGQRNLRLPTMKSHSNSRERNHSHLAQRKGVPTANHEGKTRNLQIYSNKRMSKLYLKRNAVCAHKYVVNTKKSRGGRNQVLLSLS